MHVLLYLTRSWCFLVRVGVEVGVGVVGALVQGVSTQPIVREKEIQITENNSRSHKFELIA